MESFCRLSELRIIELLENLSQDLEQYTEVTLAANGPVRWQHEDHRTANKTSTEGQELKHYKRHLRRSDFHTRLPCKFPGMRCSEVL